MNSIGIIAVLYPSILLVYVCQRMKAKSVATMVSLTLCCNEVKLVKTVLSYVYKQGSSNVGFMFVWLDQE